MKDSDEADDDFKSDMNIDKIGFKIKLIAFKILNGIVKSVLKVRLKLKASLKK